VDFQCTAVEEVGAYVRILMDLNIVSTGSPAAVGPKEPMTLKASSLPLGAVLEAWCAKVGFDWTIAPSGPEPGSVVSVVIAAPARIAELERADPVTARRLRKYRQALVRELEAAGHHGPR
jgi:hypothetical protein